MVSTQLRPYLTTLGGAALLYGETSAEDLLKIFVVTGTERSAEEDEDDVL